MSYYHNEMRRNENRYLKAKVSMQLGRLLFGILFAGLLMVIVITLSSCSISNHGVFPKMVWYWSADAKEQRREDKAAKEFNSKPSTNWQGDLEKALKSRQP